MGPLLVSRQPLLPLRTLAPTPPHSALEAEAVVVVAAARVVARGEDRTIEYLRRPLLFARTVWFLSMTKWKIVRRFWLVVA